MTNQIKIARDIDTILALLTSRFGENKKQALSWVFEAQEELMGETPIKLINEGNTDFLIKYLQGYQREGVINE